MFKVIIWWGRHDCKNKRVLFSPTKTYPLSAMIQNRNLEYNMPIRYNETKQSAQTFSFSRTKPILFFLFSFFPQWVFWNQKIIGLKGLVHIFFIPNRELRQCDQFTYDPQTFATNFSGHWEFISPYNYSPCN